ncbi:archease [Candidatus Thorarchaeota archaeon]|nr:MAG: archease [Candidatus Thorarchaeota archaeon]
MNRGYEFHGHTADITIECWGQSLEEAFEEAAVATFNVILEPSTVDVQEWVDVEVDGIDLPELLVEWIGKLIALIDIRRQFYSDFRVKYVRATERGYQLKAEIGGESIDLEKHETHTEVKAMTYADMNVRQMDDRVELTFTLDL